MSDADRTNAPAGPVFSEVDIDRALTKLDIALQDFAWQRKGDNYINTVWVFEVLHKKGVTYALIHALINRLVDQKVFQRWEKTIPPGSCWEPGYPGPVFRSETETKHALVTTYDRWYGFLAEWKGRHQVRNPPSDHAKTAVPQTITRLGSQQPPAALIEAGAQKMPEAMFDAANASTQREESGDRESQVDCVASQPPPAPVPADSPTQGIQPPQSGTATDYQHVTLDEMAAIVNRSKRTLEKLKRRRTNPLPDPAIGGGGGKPAEWLWPAVRPWLEAEYGRKLPERFPTDRFRDGRADRS
jgi:hypothetical protein